MKLARSQSWILLAAILLGVAGQAAADVQVSNGVYTASIRDASEPLKTGNWTAATGALHPTGAGNDLLYRETAGDYVEETNFSSLRSYTSGIDYACNPFVGAVDLNPYFVAEGPSAFVPPGQGWSQSWVIPEENLTITQDVLVTGSSFNDSAIYHTVLLENTGGSPIRVGWRNLYDWEVDDPGTDDSPNNSVETTGGVVVAPTLWEFSHTPAGDEFVRVSIDPGIPSYQPLLGIGYDPGFFPGLPVTTPDEYAFVKWQSAIWTAFDYTASPTMDNSQDSAGLSWFGGTVGSAISIPAGDSIRLTQVVFGVIPDDPPPGGADFSKILIGGPDENGDDEVDLVVPVKPSTSLAFTWKINWMQPGFPDVLIADTAPAESILNAINGDYTSLPIDCGDDTAFDDGTGQTDVYRGGKSGKKCKSATQIEWFPDSGSEMLVVDVSMRESPGKGHKSPAFAPTSCGALYLNNGAAAFEIDPATGNPMTDPATGDTLPPIAVSNRLCLAAVEDVNGDESLDWTGGGDEDGDTLTDLEEACVIGTDPCLKDTDGDGVRDDADECPLDDDPANPALGEILDPNGCIRQL